MPDPRLLAAARAATEGADPAHDFLHVERVVANARTIAAAEGADPAVCETAALLHELFNYPKGHPDSHRSGEVCALKAHELLRETGAPEAFAAAVAYAIRVHPFSAGITPDTLEAKVLQDADRLDAIGAIGLARLFATTTSMRRPFYDPADPFCERREPDDRSFGLDHVYRKLLRIPGLLHTGTARALAAPRVAAMHAYLAQLRREISPWEIRPERPGDGAAIRRVHELAFGGRAEADIVDALRSAGAVTLSLVACEGEAIVGHVLYSPVAIDRVSSRSPAVGLAPLAVLPDHQRRGAGRALVEASLALLREAGEPAVVVLGEPGYYLRFGFVPASRFGLRWEARDAGDAFMALELQPGALAGGPGLVRYRPEIGAG